MTSWFDTLRDLPVCEIGRVLLRHGFGHVAQRLCLGCAGGDDDSPLMR